MSIYNLMEQNNNLYPHLKADNNHKINLSAVTEINTVVIDF
jgi:hypothetical protein